MNKPVNRWMIKKKKDRREIYRKTKMNRKKKYKKSMQCTSKPTAKEKHTKQLLTWYKVVINIIIFNIKYLIDFPLNPILWDTNTCWGNICLCSQIWKQIALKRYKKTWNMTCTLHCYKTWLHTTIHNDIVSHL